MLFLNLFTFKNKKQKTKVNPNKFLIITEFDGIFRQYFGSRLKFGLDGYTKCYKQIELEVRNRGF